MEKIETMTLGQLKKVINELEQNEAINDQTKIFIDTGWDSIQELVPDGVVTGEVVEFQVEDVLTKEKFAGHSLVEKGERMDAIPETVEMAIIIKNLY